MAGRIHHREREVEIPSGVPEACERLRRAYSDRNQVADDLTGYA
jgi:hypothetical protein